MSDTEINAAIAEHLGWKRLGVSAMWHSPRGTPMGFIPDFVNDLNAMAAARKTLSAAQRVEYMECLEHVMGLDGLPIWSHADAFTAIHATASQHAEIFCRIKGLWI
jgi:hypothetical protein